MMMTWNGVNAHKAHTHCVTNHHLFANLAVHLETKPVKW